MSPARFGLPRSQRLLRPSDFEAVLRGGRRTRDAYFTVAARANDASHARLGVTVSRRTSPRAVVRNRIKRQIRESFRVAKSDLPGIDIVVVANGPAAAAPNLELKRSLIKLLQNISELCRPS
ncbi:MAG: ribonuclease P protein component [Gammaproteobacteria bacterium]